jgi:hypothetical protein
MNFPMAPPRAALKMIWGSLHGPYGVREYANRMPRGAGSRLSYVISHKPRSFDRVTERSPIVPFWTMATASDSFSLQTGSLRASNPAK